MARDITPITQLGRRMPVAGRLRAGRKGDKGEPQKLTRWRATSHDEQAIRQIAQRYGGDPHQWSDPKVAEGQWEVLTEASELPIVLPPDPLGGSPVYELWSGGGCQRRCDGETCSTVVQGPDGGEPGEVPCICAANGELECQVKTRLSVILPEVRFAGVWRIDTSSWNAARELPGMVDMIHALQAQAGGIPRGAVALEERKSTQGGQTRRFMVPALRVMHSPDEIASGRASVGALHPGREPAPALGVGRHTAEHDGDLHDQSGMTGIDAADEVEVMASDAQVTDYLALMEGLTDEQRQATEAWLAERHGVDDFGDLAEPQAEQVLAILRERAGAS